MTEWDADDERKAQRDREFVWRVLVPVVVGFAAGWFAHFLTYGAR